MICELTINLVTDIRKDQNLLGLDRPTSMFDFGDFDSFSGYHTYELLIFIFMGVLGGILGAIFNNQTKDLALWRKMR